MYPSSTPGSDAIRAQGAEMLASLIVAGASLALLGQRAHWAVRGPAFGPLHKLFGDVYGALQAVVDRLAERAAALGAVDPMGAAVVAVPVMLLPTGARALDVGLCALLAEQIDLYVATLTDAYWRAEELRLVADCNALQSVIEDVSKLGWMVRSHVVAA